MKIRTMSGFVPRTDNKTHELTVLTIAMNALQSALHILMSAYGPGDYPVRYEHTKNDHTGTDWRITVYYQEKKDE